MNIFFQSIIDKFYNGFIGETISVDVFDDANCWEQGNIYDIQSKTINGILEFTIKITSNIFKFSSPFISPNKVKASSISS